DHFFWYGFRAVFYLLLSFFGVVLLCPIHIVFPINHLDDVSERVPIGVAIGPQEALGCFNGLYCLIQLAAFLSNDLSLLIECSHQIKRISIEKILDLYEREADEFQGYDLL